MAARLGTGIQDLRSHRIIPKGRIGLTSQMRRAAVSIVSNIAEGKGRTGNRELAHFLSMSRGSLRELETQVLISAHLKYFDAEIQKELCGRIEEVSRMVSGLMKFATGSTS